MMADLQGRITSTKSLLDLISWTKFSQTDSLETESAKVGKNPPEFKFNILSYMYMHTWGIMSGDSVLGFCLLTKYKLLIFWYKFLTNKLSMKVHIFIFNINSK